MAIDSTTNRIYVANGDDSTVSVMDGSDDTVIGSPISVGATPWHIAVNPHNHNGQRYTTNTIDGNDYSSTSVAETTPFPEENQVVVNPSTNTVFTLGLGFGTGFVMRFDPGISPHGAYAGQSGASQLPGFGVSAFTHYLAVNPNTNRVYMPAAIDDGEVPPANGGLIAVDGSTMAPTAGSPLGIGRQFVAVAINPKTNKIYAVDHDDSTVAVLK